MILKLENLNKNFNEKNSLFSGFNLEIDSPSIVELSGKNGVGKTTLLSILGGICSFSGTILYDEINLKNNYDSYMQKSIFISNSPFMYDYLTVKEMIDFINDLAIPSIEWRKELSILFEDLSLKRYENVFIKDLSLGTAQKVSIIVSMLNQPSLILLDEPFVNIDKESVKVLKDFFKTYIFSHNAILIYASHDSAIANNFANKFIHLLERDGHTFVENK
ncbi:ABC transporter ATP-binding protein [Oenococcus sp. UCMA 17063]|nr:ABC transporter ATP-binding protein [Oenococcus sp. UCMA 17063]